MNMHARIEKALRLPQPALAIRTLVADLGREAMTRSEVYEVLEGFLLHLRSHNEAREVEEDIILDVMDALTDECHPSAALLPEKPVT